jgi:antitoxin CptB
VTGEGSGAEPRIGAPAMPLADPSRELARLRWRCRRGMKELDTLLVRYLEAHYVAASAEDQGRFLELLELQDPDLAAYVLGRATPEDPAFAHFIQQVATGR